MDYRAISDYKRGYSHEKDNGSEEDHAAHYADPAGRFYIGVTCDGHSDKRCFRSKRGATFGCEAAVEVLERVMTLYCEQAPEERVWPAGSEERIREAVLQTWREKYIADLKENPISEEDYAAIPDKFAARRADYRRGEHLSSIYGATFLAVAVCEDFYLALHVGDGVILCIDEQGHYYDPMPHDPVSDTGAPASLCHEDLSTRPNAFRIVREEKRPVALITTSDGIEGPLTEWGYKEYVNEILDKLRELEKPGQALESLNEEQQAYFGEKVNYFTRPNVGHNDDCSMAIIYRPAAEIPRYRMPSVEAYAEWEKILQKRNEFIAEYTQKKRERASQIRSIVSVPVRDGREAEDRTARLNLYQDTLRKMVANEQEQVDKFEEQMRMFESFFDEHAMSRTMAKRRPIEKIDPAFFEAKIQVIQSRNTHSQSADMSYRAGTNRQTQGGTDTNQSCDDQPGESTTGGNAPADNTPAVRKPWQETEEEIIAICARIQKYALDVPGGDEELNHAMAELRIARRKLREQKNEDAADADASRRKGLDVISPNW